MPRRHGSRRPTDLAGDGSRARRPWSLHPTRLQAKAGAKALPQGAFLLEADQRRDTLPIGIEEH